MSRLKIVIGNKKYSSWSLRGWLAVRHTELPYEEIQLNLDTPDFYEKITRYSPARQVPTLIDDDTVVWDSAAIIDYCARLMPDKYWWPEDNKAYAMARSIFCEMHSGFAALRNHMPMNMQGRWTGLSLSEQVNKDVRRIEKIWTQCREQHGEGGDFLFGGFSAADMMFAPVVSRFITYDIPLNSVAGAYRDAVSAYSSFTEWHADASHETAIVAIDQLPNTITRLG